MNHISSSDLTFFSPSLSSLRASWLALGEHSDLQHPSVPVPRLDHRHGDDGPFSTSVFIVRMIVMKTYTVNMRNYE